MAEIQIKGLRELKARLDSLPREIKKSAIVMRALHDAAKVIRDEARRRAPVGTAIRYVGRGAGKRRKDGTISGRAVVGGLLRSSIVEHTDPHKWNSVVIRVRNKGIAKINGKIRILRPGSSPGYWWLVEFGTSRMPAHPFMRPAFEAKKREAVTVFVNSMRRGLDSVAQSLRNRYR